ncbi:MAG: molybdenum cofactor biosynthesis protein [Lysobacteraceae bacterium]|nr:MAG: molybdenum cofactor biosynthesis protein [Xanthomonadaceae bacterium]
MLDPKSNQCVGRVVGLWRYPVKSMAGEPLSDTEVSWHGLAGDRRWAFVRGDAPNSGFPWFTLREKSDMSRYRPSFADPSRPDKSRTVVTTPTGERLDVTDPALLATLDPGSEGVRVIKNDRGVFDTFPLSVITTSTIAELGNRVGQSLAVERFRPNIVVELADDVPFVEDQWVGRELQIGTLRMRIDKRDGRCVVITIDPKTFERNTDILKTVARERQGCLGVYGSTVEPGRVAVDDNVLVVAG